VSDPIPVQSTHPLINISSPLTLIGIFVAILRDRFSPDTYSDPPLKSEWLWQSALKSTGIYIESGWNEQLEGRNLRPGLWVDRDQTVYGKVSIGNRDQIPTILATRHELFYADAQTDISIDCTSKDRGESMMLGSLVQDFLQMSARYLMAEFGLRDISPVVLNKTVPFERDRELMGSQVQLRVSYEARWATVPIAQLLSEIRSRIADKDDPEKYFREIALRV